MTITTDALPPEDEIIEMLNSAVSENYYDDLVDWSDYDIAMDMICYCPGMEGIHPDNADLHAAIAAWRKQLKKENVDGAKGQAGE